MHLRLIYLYSLDKHTVGFDLVPLSLSPSVCLSLIQASEPTLRFLLYKYGPASPFLPLSLVLLVLGLLGSGLRLLLGAALRCPCLRPRRRGVGGSL